MNSPPTRLLCAGCGAALPPDRPYPFRCLQAKAQDDIDHVLHRVLMPAAVGAPADTRSLFLASEPNPFKKFRRLFHAYQTARNRGFEDRDYVALVERLDAAVARVEGHGFRETPFAPAEELELRLGFEESGGVWVKDETGNVSGSHKGRHLMGILLWLEVARKLELTGVDDPPLAIASCGNAALAAAVVARAGERSLEVFIPPDADPSVTDRLTALGARLAVCPRQAATPGDPCYHRFREAITGGALPFTCQGNENGLTIEGGETLVWEMVSVLLRENRSIDHLFIQVGGGALASACIEGLWDAQKLGILGEMPRIHTVHTRGAFPLRRAWERLVQQISTRHREQGGEDLSEHREPASLAQRVLERVSPMVVDAELRYAATHRSEFMRPWEEEPRSIARGILDDETYDWLTVLDGMLTTGGVPWVVSEERLREAHRLAGEATGIPVDPTGTAGLAGLLEAREAGVVAPSDTVAVLFTGIER
ncbi:MAG: pyridoxal-phosphate dependent enzyme [Thermoanaerobaculia bacterium]